MFSNMAKSGEDARDATNKSRSRPVAVLIRRQPAFVGQRDPAGIGQSVKSGAMTHLNARSHTQSRKGFHDASARETYASRFRPIAIQAVAAGTRRNPHALKESGEARKADLPSVLRHGFDD